MDDNKLSTYYQYQLLQASCPNLTAEYRSSLIDLVAQSKHQNHYSKPMPWIGMYIALASLCCILAMVADLLHGLRNRKLWFPCKYFSLNAASLTVAAVAIKLPMDLTTLMSGPVEHGSKLISISFMCAMMANLLPSLATMDSKELVSNMIALGILVITLVVNICIQIYNGIIFNAEGFVEFTRSEPPLFFRVYYLASTVVPLLMMLIIYACASLAILKSKQIVESKYQAAHEKISKDQELRQPGRLLTIEKLKQHVSNYWIMAGTGNPSSWQLALLQPLLLG
ncbi:hypothetical protein L2E82_51292 [Cichorium intybus]|nr:hypothetical protein L2E82_51292 [Cichorium intybus]